MNYQALLLVCLLPFTNQQKSQGTPTSEFTCPEDFGYFPHPTDCTQYYVCVFGGALLESCTGGLMYSHELQTCDWPRNVYCFNNTAVVDNNLENTQQSGRGSRSSAAAVTQRPGTAYAYTPIKIETIGQLRNAEEVGGKKLTRVEDEYTQQRSGRSYEGSLPNYKEEIYQNQGSHELNKVDEHNIVKRDVSSTHTSLKDARKTKRKEEVGNVTTHTDVNRHTRAVRNTRFRNTRHSIFDSFVRRREPRVNRRMDISDTNDLIKYKLPVRAGLKGKPAGNYLSHRVSSPGNILYPPSYYQTPTYGFVNIDSLRGSVPARLRPNPTTTAAPRVVKITSSKPSTGDNVRGSSYYSSHAVQNLPLALGEYQHHHHHHHALHGGAVPFKHEVVGYKQPEVNPNSRWKLVHNVGHEGYYGIEVLNRPALNTNIHNPNTHAGALFEHDKRLSEYVTNAYVNRLTLPVTKNTSSSIGSVSSSPLTSNTRSKYAGGTNKYYDNGAPAPQQEEYANDDVYVNQRYAANVGNNSNYYYAPAGEEDDSSYYVYDDEEEDSASQAPAPANKYTGADFGKQDYKYQQPAQQPQQPYTRAPVTRRPVPATQPPPTRAPSTRTRTRGGSSSSSSSSSTRSRPTLKPKSQFKTQSAPVRDVYLDAPSRPENIYETPNPNTPATKCRKDLCVLPDCSCGGKEIPGGLTLQQTPQIVLLTFDDSVNDLNKNLYRDLFEKGRKNPNGCPISATFYISHEWTDYSQVQNLAADGHEIASHSVSHSFGEQYSQKKWDREINGQREILAAYGGVKLSEVRGMRAPFLAIGGNNMFKMLHDSNFTYDSSMPIYENRPPSWPYTLDYRIFHDCMIPPCPTKSYPGVWEVPMVMWQDLKGGRCSMGDACSNPPTAEGVYQMLAKNFERHYTTNRAPFGLYYHAAWFTQAHHKEGFEAFLDTLVQMDDVWLVTNYQALQWIRNPTPNNRILNFEPWSCHDLKDRPPRCNHPKVCNLWHKSGVRYMKTCQSCPQQYPWTGNTGVPYSNSI